MLAACALPASRVVRRNRDLNSDMAVSGESPVGIGSVPQADGIRQFGGGRLSCRLFDAVGAGMGQAKNRGSQAERIAQAQAKVAASRPEKLVCNSCGANVSQINPVSTRGLRGLDAIWVGQCDCGHTTFAATGEPKAVDAFFFALSENTELTLGSQSKDGGEHHTA